jgi:hypothetical protein
MDRIQLQKMIDANQVQDCTDDIRSKKHSQPISDDVNRLLQLKAKYKRLAETNPTQFDAMCVSQCNFLFCNYTDIFNKVKKDEMNLEVLNKLLNVLKRIEDGELDQHEGAFAVGSLLKQIYIDSALMKAEKLDKQGKPIKNTSRPKPKKISYSDFKKQLEEVQQA